jgi:uncharacterized protein YccT (UPF0319 family)
LWARALVILGAFSSASTFATETNATPSTELDTLVVNATKLDKSEDSYCTRHGCRRCL